MTEEIKAQIEYIKDCLNLMDDGNYKELRGGALSTLKSMEEQLTLTSVVSSKNKSQALARLKILKDISNEYESNGLEVSNKFFLKELKKQITNAFWHGWTM